MDRKRRRLVIGGAIVVALLVFGRWSAGFVTARLWEADVSPAAALVGTRFGLLETALELAGLLIAVAWFAIHFVWVTRSVTLQFGDLPRPLGRFSERTVYLVALGIGAILGVGVGGGTGLWLPAILVDMAGVQFGLQDRLLQIDLGVFVAELPVQELLFDRAVALVVPALVAVTVVSIAGGLLRFAERRLWLARSARRQLALLLAAAAVLIAWSEWLTPFRLAASRTPELAQSEFLLRTTVSQVVTLFALTAAVLTGLWGLRFRFMVALGGWVGLGLALLGGSLLVQSRAADGPGIEVEAEQLRALDSAAFGVGYRPLAHLAVDSQAPSLWDPEVVRRLVATDSVPAVGAWPGELEVAGRRSRVWFVLRGAAGSDPALVAVADDRVGPTGGITSLRYGDDSFLPGVVPLVTLSRHDARPGAPAFDLSPGASGVALWSQSRRIALAWGLQLGAALRADPEAKVAWRLDPGQRLTGIAPFADWSAPRVVVADRAVYWVLSGFLTVDRFPSSRTLAWRGADVGYARAAFVGVVSARDGLATVYLRPDADSLAHAWARVAAPLIEPADSLPPAIRRQLGSPADLAGVAAEVLRAPTWLGGPVAGPRPSYPAGHLANLGTATDPYLIPVADSAGQRLRGLLSLTDAAGFRFFAADSDRTVDLPNDLQQRWDRFPFFRQLQDSVRAGESEFVAGGIRYGAVGDTLVAYQPNYAVSATGAGGVVLVNLAMGGRLGAGRTLAEAWRNLRGEIGPLPVGTDARSRLEQARQWLDQADAALKRGDLLEFGRAFSYLRELLRPGTELAPPPP